MQPVRCRYRLSDGSITVKQSQRKMESIIDTLHAAQTKKTPKPRTYREKARKAYLVVVELTPVK
jgi:IS5 family transposase